MAKKGFDDKKKMEDVYLEIFQRLEEYHRDVRIAIETVTQVPHRLMDTEEVCKAMDISPKTLRRYARWFGFPVRKVGNRNLYFGAEIKNAVLKGLGFWKE